MTFERPHVSYSITSIEAVHKPNRVCTIHQTIFPIIEDPVNTLFLIGNVASIYLNECLRLLLEEVPGDATKRTVITRPTDQHL